MERWITFCWGSGIRCFQNAHQDIIGFGLLVYFMNASGPVHNRFSVINATMHTRSGSPPSPLLGLKKNKSWFICICRCPVVCKVTRFLSYSVAKVVEFQLIIMMGHLDLVQEVSK